MKTKICIYFNVILFFVYFSSNNAFCGGGGGSCEIIKVIAAPYSGEESISKELIIQKKKDSDKKRIIKSTDLPMYTLVLDYCHSIGLRYENGEQTKFYFYGFVPKLHKSLKIKFSDIDSIEIKELYNVYGYETRALVKVTVFPSISIENLLREKPDYTTLKEKYSKEVLIIIKIRDAIKGNLQLVCNEDDYSQYTPIESLVYLPKGYKIPFSFEIRSDAPVWWAIEEVIKDRSYPYKVTEIVSINGLPENSLPK